MRRAVIGTLLVLIVALAGCGDDDDEVLSRDDEEQDAAEFCDQVEALEEADDAGELDDLTDDDDREAALELFGDLEDAAPDDIQDDVEILREFIEDFADEDVEDFDEDEQEEFEDRLEEANDSVEELEEFADEECDIQLELDDDDDNGGDETTTTEEDGGGDDDLDELVDACGNGDLAACDELFLATPIDSPEEDFAQTCGGLVAEPIVSGFCEDVFDGSPAGTPPTAAEADLQASTNACGQGDFAACDQVFRESGVDSPEEEYAQACGGRLAEPRLTGQCEVVFANA
jgi:hypothetical protein